MTRRRTVAIAAATIAAIVLVIVTRAVWQGRTALSRGDAALAADRVEEAISHWRRSARWYVPLAPHVAGAYDRLEKTAMAADSAGDKTTALIAWRGIRSSVLSTRSFFTPFGDRLNTANERIAVLMAQLEEPSADPDASETERASWHRALLEEPVGPSIGFSILAIVGFLLWLGGAFWFAWFGVTDDKDSLNRSVAIRAFGAILIGLGIWLVGLYLA